jgi:hypothetical protein
MKLIIVIASLFILSCNDTVPNGKVYDFNAIQKVPDLSPAGNYQVNSDQFSGTLEILENGTFKQKIFKFKTSQVLKEIHGSWSLNQKREIDSYMDDRIFPIQFKDSIWNYNVKNTVSLITPRLLLSQKGDVKILISGNQHYWKKL